MNEIEHTEAVYQKDSIPTDLRWAVWNRDDFTCHYCGSRERLAIDHKVPESKGGETVAENLLTACVRCNSRKGTKSYEEFMMEVGDVELPEIGEDGVVGTYQKSFGKLDPHEALQYLYDRTFAAKKILKDLRIRTEFQLKRHGKKLEKLLPSHVMELAGITAKARFSLVEIAEFEAAFNAVLAEAYENPGDLGGYTWSPVRFRILLEDDMKNGPFEFGVLCTDGSVLSCYVALNTKDPGLISMSDNMYSITMSLTSVVVHYFMRDPLMRRFFPCLNEYGYQAIYMSLMDRIHSRPYCKLTP